MNNNYYITTPIYYVNDKPHIGHAYTTIACDVLARAKRLQGYNVKFLTGTDEHGQKVEKSAEANGTTPQALADKNSSYFRELTDILNISNDDFIRTTEERHKLAAQAMWKRMEEKGYIYLDSYKGWYAVRDEAYYNESELIDGKAPTGAEVEWVEEPSYFFKLSAFEDKLLELYESNPSFISPNTRKNEITRFVEGGLRDLSISRTTFAWGVPVPGNEDHIMYVWLDALTNYLSALGFPDESSSEYTQFWPASVHMVGKDIIRFHTVYWPAFLMAADLPLPEQVFAHGWWTIEGEKISKSLGNSIAPQELIDQYGLDYTRWYLMREIPFGNDGNFSHDRLIKVINSDLSNNIGNLSQRVLSMIHKNCEGKIQFEGERINNNTLEELYYNSLEDINNNLDLVKIHSAAISIAQFADALNVYIDEKAPWTLKKTDPEAMTHILAELAEGIRCISLLLQIFIPDSASKLLDGLNIPLENRDLTAVSKEQGLKSGHQINKPEPVFPRLEAQAGEPS